MPQTIPLCVIFLMPLKIVRTIPALKVNPGIRAAYRRALDSLVRAMGKDVVAKVLEAYDKIEWPKVYI